MKDADVVQLVEHRLPKPVVGGSNPLIRSCVRERRYEEVQNSTGDYRDSFDNSRNDFKVNS